MKPTIYIHHTGKKNRGRYLSHANAFHQREGYPISTFGYYTFYQWFIEPQGKIIQTRREMDPDVVYKDAHKNSISVCLGGNFNNEFPTREQYKALSLLFNSLKQRYGINHFNIKEHREYQNTFCPGLALPRGHFAQLFVYTQYNFFMRELNLLLIKFQNLLK